jgi:hypothetical protein
MPGLREQGLVETLLNEVYPPPEMRLFTQNPIWEKEYKFHHVRKWRMDYAVPRALVAIEVQGGLFVKGAHSNPAAIRSYYEKLNAAASLGWRVWQYAPEQIIKAGRKNGKPASHSLCA